MLLKKQLGLSGVILLMFCLSACDNSQETNTDSPVVRPVKFITVDLAGTADVSQFPAVIGAHRLSELSLPVGGMLKKFPVKEAQRLERGDLIAQLDQKNFKSSVSSAKAQFKNAEQEYKRAARLIKEGAISRSTLEQNKAQYDVSKAQLDQAEKALADSVLRAPFTGIVAKKFVKNLQTLSAGQEVVKFMSADILEATIDLPARYLANIPKEETENGHRQAFVMLDAAPNKLIDAEFKEATLIADTTSQTYAITFTFRSPEQLTVLPGMNATVELRFEKVEEAMRVAVPLDAITNDGEKNYVWLINKDNMTVSKQAVEIEDGVGQSIVVTKGLNINDTIVGAGSAYLSEGMEVREWK